MQHVADMNAPSASVATTVRLLGPLTVVRDGHPVEAHLSSRQARTVFAALVLRHDRLLPAERLADILWEDEQPASWRAALRGLVSKARSHATSTIPGATLTSSSEGYRLLVPDGITVDVGVVRRRIVEAEVALEEDDLALAAERAADVVGPTVQQLLPGIEGRWVERVRNELHLARLRALHVLGAVHLGHDQPARAVRAAMEAIELEPLHEASHRLRMRSLAASGETAEAARAYDECRQLLVEELGIGPSPQTTDLLEEILRTTT